MTLPRNETRLCTRMHDVRYGWGDRRPKGAKTYVTCDSHVVPHRSTEQAQGCLTSEFGWDPVLSPWYERMMGTDGGARTRGCLRRFTARFDFDPAL